MNKRIEQALYKRRSKWQTQKRDYTQLIKNDRLKLGDTITYLMHLHKVSLNLFDHSRMSIHQFTNRNPHTASEDVSWRMSVSLESDLVLCSKIKMYTFYNHFLFCIMVQKNTRVYVQSCIVSVSKFGILISNESEQITVVYILHKPLASLLVRKRARHEEMHAYSIILCT